MAPPLDRLVATVRRTTREDVRISLRERRGGVGVELRVAAARNGRGPMVETPQGLRLPPEQLREMIEALQDAERLALALGILPGRGPDAINKG